MLYNNSSMRKIQFVLSAILCIMAVSGMPEYGHYYVSVPCEDHSAKALIDMIGNSKFSIPYEYGKFDCSEMSAYLEWFLKSHGFKTKMCINKSIASGFGGAIPGHLWIMVEVTNNNTGKNETVYVESTSIPIKVYESDMIGYENYTHPRKTFDTVFHMVTDGLLETEIDWWKNVREIPQGSTMTVRVNEPYTIISKSEFPDISIKRTISFLS